MTHTLSKNSRGAIPLGQEIEDEWDDEIGPGREEKGSPVHYNSEPALYEMRQR